MLDFQHKTRATLCQLPSAKMRNLRKDLDDTSRKDSDAASEKPVKWAEFGCAAWKGNIVISGGKETKKVSLSSFKLALGFYGRPIDCLCEKIFGLCVYYKGGEPAARRPHEARLSFECGPRQNFVKCTTNW